MSEFDKQMSEEPEFSIKGIFNNWWHLILVIKINWKSIFFAGLLGALVGLGVSLISKLSYTARLTFVVEEGGQDGSGMISALAGQFGMDLGGMAGANGVLAGDNVQELLKSRSIIKRVLLSESLFKNNLTIADDYALAYGWQEKWIKKSNIGPENAFFSRLKPKFTRIQDSLLQLIMKQIIAKELTISKPDKKLSFFELNITNKNELLGQVICLRLIKEATDFYIDTKTRRLRINVDRLQHKSDSLEFLLNRKTINSLAANKDILNINPAYTTAGAEVEITNRDKIMMSSIYAEVVKNLEISKTALIQETPTVQIVDKPELPLKKNKMEWWLLIGLFSTFGIIVVITWKMITFESVTN